MTEPVPFELVNRRGQTVRGVYQRGDGPSGGERPLVVMSTAFGQTFRKYLSAAAFFSRNGWDVVRYDITNHPGLSDGNPVDMRLTWMCEDLMDVVDACAATEEWPTVAVFAASLGARVALRATAEDPRIRALAMVACVVDARATMAVANGIDWFEVWLDSDRTEVDAVRETYGGPMSARCVIDMLEHGWDGIEGTRADLERIGVPVLDVAGGCDEWVALEDVRGVFGAGRPSSWSSTTRSTTSRWATPAWRWRRSCRGSAACSMSARHWRPTSSNPPSARWRARTGRSDTSRSSGPPMDRGMRRPARCGAFRPTEAPYRCADALSWRLMEPASESQQPVVKAVLARVVERFGMDEVSGEDGGPRLLLRSPQDGSRVGECRIWVGGPLERLVYVGLDVAAIRLDSNMVCAFTPPASAVPHFTLDTVAAPGTNALHLDLVPRTDLGAHVEYVRFCYDLLTDTTLDVAAWEGLSPASLTPLQYAMTSPWVLVYRATPAAFACARAGRRVPRALVRARRGRAAAPRERHGRRRVAAGAGPPPPRLPVRPAVDPAWEQMDRIVGADDSAAIRAILRGD